MTIVELALFIALLVFVILLVATILNNPSEFYTKTPWFEITLYVKYRASKLNDWLLPPPGYTLFRLPNHNNLISFKYHCFMNTIAVIVSVFTCVLTLMILAELKQILLVKLIHQIVWGLPTYWFFYLFSMPCIFLLIKKL
ncbi:hypothetical protein [Arthrospira platensis]|uniref:Uncharacterized protein n=1 Tax=Limnospira platensis NIES-46 TaxID=1236695 RepID=A0A5M3TEW8_LIMPL|nr:hypothetical protein [Arthrospira platensis]AMW31093.1 hypothetical protein AP285_27415 [Arthrospira platensis YZ]KDR58598.1 hypothetical protein APPUASWS_004220 [Arthrospira platensis str. Paraca]MBD2669115.1 hypothetical protein [Arthrospira platensis FACHB-439]MBD2712358.1 hypothetical protein [Arthrospira platensis FACHB-835]MDF2208495.1 hypothetical protein [Arthrospira platensis NCB002]MDT9185337.1 hypothetical protein [Limnospira sp. PMC 289.06]MDT9297557.1 hypothetical protein [Ar